MREVKECMPPVYFWRKLKIWLHFPVQYLGRSMRLRVCMSGTQLTSAKPGLWRWLGLVGFFYKSENQVPSITFLLPKWILRCLSFAAKLYYLKVNYLLKFCGGMRSSCYRISFWTNLWLENKSSFFSFLPFIICVLYIPLDSFINY